MKNICCRIISKLCHVSCEIIGKLLSTKGYVYMLHEISGKEDQFCISRKELASFLSSLDKEKVIKLSEWETKTDFIAITIDDVPENFYYNGFPLFKKYEIPFTIFVNTSLLDTPGFLQSDQLKEIANCELCTVGSHGTVHQFYKRFSRKEKILFLENSKKTLSDICDRNIELFAFPYGSVYACGFQDIKLVSRYYKYGFCTIASPITKPGLLNSSFLPRINLTKSLIKNEKTS